jgi:hypothetical protein
VRLRADGFRVTRHAWILLALGSVVVAGMAGFAATQGRSSPSTDTPASWGLYSSSDWAALKAGFARRGFARDSVRVVTGTKLASGQPFALLAGRSNVRSTCFAVARGSAVGGTICRLSRPVAVFSAPDTCAACSAGGRATRVQTILGLVRPDVTVTMIHDGRESGIGVVRAGKGFAFNASPVGVGDRLRARDAHRRVLATIGF